MGNTYQFFLIVLGCIATFFLGIFFYREVAPEYLIYQNDYIALEKFRSSYTHEPTPDFKTGVKQILIEREDKGPPLIDRCVTCHVALQIEDFSPTKIAKDLNGNIRYDAQGYPVKEENPNYVWKHLNEKIGELRDQKVNEQLKSNGENEKVKARLKEAENLEKLKFAEVGDIQYDVEKVLAMHPLIGKETRPFEFHSIDEYGCTACHGGNGRGIVTDRAHGPVFDGQYEVEYQGPRPKFLETDKENDPLFSKVFNDKPGARLIFQTSPLYVGALIQAKCLNCHLDTKGEIEKAANSALSALSKSEQETARQKKALELEKQAILALIELNILLDRYGYENTVKELEKSREDYSLNELERSKIESQIVFLTKAKNSEAKLKINKILQESFGSEKLSLEFQKQFSSKEPKQSLNQFINATIKDPEATGTLYQKVTELNLSEAILEHIREVGSSFEEAVKNPQALSSIQTDVDRLTSGYHQGKDLYVSQACYACHRISGFSKGGVGPDLTFEGNAYPWYVKQKISWPQSDLPTSTMPNYRLDHEELAALVTYVLGQKGPGLKFSETAYKNFIQEWEAGKLKQPFEKPVTPREIHDVRFGMTVFATEGCAACHRLRGFESNVGFKIEKETQDFEKVYQEHEWFQNLFPENLQGSKIVKILEEQGAEIDQRIVDGVRQNSILEEIEKNHPGAIEAFYTNFKFASRAHNKKLKDLISFEKDPKKKEKFESELSKWKERVNRVLKIYIQEYGLGRLICPRPNWSGVFRTDEWLMEHFKNPSSHVPRSIMPVFPFDDTKFYALTYMLDVLGKKNVEGDRQIWEHNGFNPAQAFQKYCSQCHGEYLLGNGPVSEWIYPIPKNLRNGEFLRNLTKENAILSITHGVKGTPMPPWGELGLDKPVKNVHPVFTETEIKQLVNWLFSSLPGGTVIKEENVPKWRYKPEDIKRELEQEGNELKSDHSFIDLFPKSKNYLAALDPMPAEKEEDIFDRVKNKQDGSELYYIKKKYYTTENIQQGKDFFEIYCATCHGREADGSGLRAEVMREAKPRMLINLDWINSRDDLRLLRSIKYGVPGTAMTPWGDQTSALQRLQLVIFIRSLTQNQEERGSLNSTLYKTFDSADYTLEQARIHEYTELDKTRQEYEKAKKQRQNLDREVLENKVKPEEALKSFQKEIDLGKAVSIRKNLDKLFIELRSYLKEEKEIYRSMGDSLLNAEIDGESMEDLLKLISLNKDRFSLQNYHLHWEEKNQRQEFQTLKEKLEKGIEQLLKNEEQERKLLEGKLSSSETADKLKALDAKIKSLKKVKIKIASGLHEALELKKKEKEIYQSINETVKSSEK